MITTPAVEHSGRLLAASPIAWHELALVLAGIFLLVLARLVVYFQRRREAIHATRVPLIETPTPAPPGKPPRPAWPPPGFFERRAAQHRAAERRAAERAHRAAEHNTAQHSAVDDVEWGEEVRAGPVRFHRPPEGTLQLLPGRLEIVSGTEGVETIRFVKVPGKEPVVTFGRSPGEPHTHVELQSPTVSRQHATMRFENGSWHVTNLSTTNPVVVRGRQLKVGDEPVRLEDGDAIEMGEVTFRFHTRHVAERAAQVVAPPPIAAAVREPRLAASVAVAAGPAAIDLNGSASRAAGRAHALTGREIEIARMVAERKSNRAISELLDISPRTVSTHLTNIFRKLEVASRGELADYMGRQRRD